MTWPHRALDLKTFEYNNNKVYGQDLLLLGIDWNCISFWIIVIIIKVKIVISWDFLIQANFFFVYYIKFDYSVESKANRDQKNTREEKKVKLKPTHSIKKLNQNKWLAKKQLIYFFPFDYLFIKSDTIDTTTKKNE